MKDITQLDLKKLKYVVTVAQELSFSRAAQRLNIAQPPLSQQIRKIEGFLDIQLFNRSTRQVTLTPKGERFIAQANKVLEAHNELISYAQALTNVEKTTFRLGSISLAIDVLIAPIIKTFYEMRPYDVLSLEEGTSQQLIIQCQNNIIDAAIVRLHAIDLPSEHLYLIKREPYVLAIPKSWKGFDDKVCLSQLKDKPYIGYPTELHPELHKAFLEIFHSAGNSPTLVQKVKTKSVTLSLVANQIGYAIVPKSLSSKYLKEIHFAEIEQSLPTVDYYLYYREKNLHPCIKVLIKLLKS